MAAVTTSTPRQGPHWIFLSSDFTVRGGPPIVLRCAADLEPALGVLEGTVVVAGPWALLNSRCARTLAEWSLDDPDRAVAMFDVAGSKRPRRPRPAGELSFLELGSPTTTAGASTAGEQLECLSTGEGVDVLSLTGPGDEHGVGVGGCWVAATERAGLDGAVVPPDGLAAAVVFLNTCSSARGGDSLVPPEHHLGRSLFLRGRDVVGAFRKLTCSDQLPGLLRRELRRGRTLGQAVNTLNRALVAQGEPASLMIWGEPDWARATEHRS